MEKLKALFTKRVAGVPVGVFFVLMAGGLVWLAFKVPSASTGDETDTTDAAATDTDTSGEDVPAGDATATNPVFVANTTPSTVATTADSGAQDTNELWGNRVRPWLVGQGATIDMASAVVSKYLAGQSLTAEEGKWRDMAVEHFGFPPENVDYAATASAVTTYSGPASRQGTPPLKHTVKGTTDDTAAELARLYYGSPLADDINLIAAANKGDAKPTGPYPVGTKVNIPKHTNPVYYRATSATHTDYAIAKKNGTTAAALMALNPTLKWPIKVGQLVRVK